MTFLGQPTSIYTYMSGPYPSIDSVNTSDKRYNPSPGNGAIPPPPTWLNKNARKIYKHTAKKLTELGVAGSADESILALFSMQLDRLTVLGKKGELELKEARMANDLVAQILSLSRELALTPSARAKMRIKAMEPDTDPLTELLDDES